MAHSRSQYRGRLCVWTKPSTAQNKNSGAASRPSMLNQPGTTPVKAKK